MATASMTRRAPGDQTDKDDVIGVLLAKDLARDTTRRGGFNAARCLRLGGVTVLLAQAFLRAAAAHVHGASLQNIPNPPQ